MTLKTMARVGAFVVATAFIVVSPVFRQCAGIDVPALPDWSMFHSTGLHQCRVTFFVRDSDGKESRLDRLAVLGIDDKTARYQRRQLKGEKAVRQQAADICRRQHLTELTADASCATYEGWHRVIKRTENLCASPKPSSTKSVVKP